MTPVRVKILSVSPVDHRGRRCRGASRAGPPSVGWRSRSTVVPASEAKRGDVAARARSTAIVPLRDVTEATSISETAAEAKRGDGDAGGRSTTIPPLRDFAKKGSSITETTDRILRGQDSERSDFLSFLTGESSFSDVGLDVDDAETMSSWKFSDAGDGRRNENRRRKEEEEKKKNDAAASARRTERISAKIERQASERSGLLAYYMGDATLDDIGINLDDLNEIKAVREWREDMEEAEHKGNSDHRQQWREADAEAGTRWEGSIADSIVRNEGKGERANRLRYFLGEIELDDLGIDLDELAKWSETTMGEGSSEEIRRGSVTARFAIEMDGMDLPHPNVGRRGSGDDGKELMPESSQVTIETLADLIMQQLTRQRREESKLADQVNETRRSYLERALATRDLQCLGGS